MKLLVETTDYVEISEAVNPESNSQNLYLTGVTLQAEVVNSNNRYYPITVLKDAVDLYCEKYLNDNRAVGELDHPKSTMQNIDPDRISHRFVEVRQEGNDFISKALILDTVCGRQVRNLVNGGVKLGMSQRGFGRTKRDPNGTIMIESLYLVTLADIVVDPSAPQAFSQAIYENQEWVFENGMLIEKDVEPIIDRGKAALKLSKNERKSIIQDVYQEYLESINIRPNKNFKTYKEILFS